VNNCHIVYANGFSVRHSYSGTLVRYLPVSAFAFPRLVYSVTRRLDDTQHAHTHTLIHKVAYWLLNYTKNCGHAKTRLDFISRAKQKSAISLT
jgi:hypothetical protein